MASRRAFTPEDLWAIRRVGRPEPLPDGSAVVVPVTDHDVAANETTTRLHLVPADGGSPHPLTAPGASCTQPAVSRDGRSLAFVRKPVGDEEAKGQIAVMRLDGGEADTVTDLPLGAAGPRWLPDGSGLVFAVPLYRDAPAVEASRETRAERRDNTMKARVTEDRVYRFWNRWLAGEEIHHLFVLDLASGELRDLTPGWDHWIELEDPAGGYDVSPDGSEVAFASDCSEPPHDRLQWAVFTVPTAGGAVRRLTAELPAHQWRPRYSPDGRHLLYGVQREHDFYADRVRLVRFDRATATETVLTEQWDRSASEWEFAGPDRIVLSAEDRGRTALFGMPVEVTDPARLTSAGSCRGPRPAGETVFCRTESMTGPPEVARIPLDGGEPDVVWSFNRDLLSDIEMGAVEEIEFAGARGDSVQAYVVYPPKFDPERTWPLVHVIHGGPHGVTGDAFHFRWNHQLLAAPGYVVIAVNFHGSTSWGQEFAASILGAWGDLPAIDIHAATDHMLDRGFIDEDRIAVAGGSYGGYLATWMTAVSDRFACAVCHAGVTDLLGQWASDITEGRARAMGGLPWDGLDDVLRWSPATHTTGMNTPTLVIHGENDYRVVVTQGLALYGILKAKGVEARLVYYPDEGHWILKPQNSLHWHGEFLGWLARYLDSAG